MNIKQIALVVGIATLVAGSALVAGCISDEQATIVGTWKSTGTYEANDITFSQLYTFAADSSGTLSAVNVEDGSIIKTIQAMWGYDDTQNAYMAYTPSTGNYDYLILSDDGKTLISEYGEVYTRV